MAAGVIYKDNAGRQGKPVLLKGEGLVYIELRPDLDFETIRGNVGIPTLETQGIFRGFSLPLWVADNNEELFATICVPSRWDGASDIYVHLDCWLALAEVNKNFNLQVTWEHYNPGTDAIPATSANVEVETVANAAQFQSYTVEFTLAYGDLLADDIIGLRIRRIAAVGAECVGEIVINHYGVIFRRDKLGVATP